MTADELFKAGRLNEAVEAQIQAVKAAPADHAKRLFLFELSVFSGDLERAKRQIELIKFDDMDLQMAVVTYRRLLDAEETRRKVFSGGLPPKFLVDPPEHCQLRVEALARLRAGKNDEATDFLEKAIEATPARPGKIDGRPFESIRDCDDLFGPVVEGLVNGEYYWIPFDIVVNLDRKPHKFPRDLFWAPATLELEASQGELFLSALYPMSHESADESLKLGRATDWKVFENGPTLGIGHKLLEVGEETIPILEFSSLSFD